MASGQIEMAALGRPFALGMLYDACKEELDTGFTLWDKETICKLKTQISQTNCEFDLVTSDTTDSSNALVEVNESLKVGVMCGLIDLKQSAKFLIGTNKSKNQNRIILHYTSTTTMEQLPLSLNEVNRLSVQDFPKKTQATHVVTGILKGANAFFVFDSENTDETHFHDIKNTIKAELRKIQSERVGGKAGFKISEKVKALTNKLSCKFHGDFILNKNPATFEDAINAYSELPKLLGENGEKAVPVKVWLTPLKSLNPSAAELKRDISASLIRKVEKTLESLTEMEIKCKTFLGDEVVKKIPQIEKKLQNFKTHCGDYKAELQKTMKEKIPRIRRGLEEEISVEKYLDDQEESPFRKENLKKWLNNAEKEIDSIKVCVTILKKAINIEIVQKETELKTKALKARSRHSLCFVFTSVESKDPYLDQMERYLNNVGTQTPDRVTPPPEDLWFHSEDVPKRMEKKARKLIKHRKFPIFFFTYSYFIAALKNKNYEGATIYYYKKGEEKNKDFSLLTRK